MIEHVHALRCGRRLGFSEYGERGGAPLLWFPGTPGSRLLHPLLAASASRHRLRLISVERPGFGLSDFAPGRTIAQWAHDVRDLVDALGLDRFAIAGMSGAGPYLASCASVLGDRVRLAAFIGCGGPVDAPRALERMSLRRRAALVVAHHAPRLLEAGLEAAYDRDRDVERFYRQMVTDFPEVDRAQLRRPEVYASLIAMTREALRPGFRGFAYELSLFARPWDVPLHAIKASVHIWHGALDRSTPLAMAEHLARTIPGARLRVFPDQGHFLLFAHCDAMMASLAA